jgi:hypothetical protein
MNHARRSGGKLTKIVERAASTETTAEFVTTLAHDSSCGMATRSMATRRKQAKISVGLEKPKEEEKRANQLYRKEEKIKGNKSQTRTANTPDF